MNITQKQHKFDGSLDVCKIEDGTTLNAFLIEMIEAKSGFVHNFPIICEAYKSER